VRSTLIARAQFATDAPSVQYRISRVPAGREVRVLPEDSVIGVFPDTGALKLIGGSIVLSGEGRLQDKMVVALDPRVTMAEQLRSSIVVQPTNKDANVLMISYTGPDSQLVRDIPNAVARAFDAWRDLGVGHVQVDLRPAGERTIEVLAAAKRHRPSVLTKTSLMLGLGETDDELRACMADLRGASLDILTLGQYLQPTTNHLRVERFVTPDQFAQYRDWALESGFLECVSGPLVRSSYRAETTLARYLEPV